MRSKTLLTSLYLFHSTLAAAEDPDWQQHLDRIERSVVVLKVDQTRSFDGDYSSSTQATGFVVNAEKGLILTNRHVVCPGPVTAKAIFSNNESVELEAVYRDPVHDFGIFRFNPEDLIAISPEGLELHPEGASVGAEIRVVGNDAGEKLSIMHGTLARLDRPAPYYGSGYNDFNTFYYQAGSSTSGGSSGSPVIDISGRVIALNAGSKKKSAASFYLPLNRVQRALELIERGEEVERGTIQAVWSSTPYDKLRALGLDAATEAELRERWPEKRALLVVSEILPYGPADDELELGDILLEVDGLPIADFVPLEAILDAKVDEQVKIKILRSGTPTEVSVWVDDLHRITPSSFLEFGGGILHDLSYHQARNQGVHMGGVYVASTGFVFGQAKIPRHAVITEANGELIDTIQDLERVISMLPDGAPLSMRYFHRSNPVQVTEGLVHVDRLWFPMRLCVRDGSEWPCTESAVPDTTYEPPRLQASRVPQEKRWAKALSPSLVIVDFDIPYKVAGINGSSYRGTGLVVDADQGLVVVDRDTVPVALGEVEITIAGLVKIPAQVVGLHPRHNLALVSYDPSLTTGLGLESAVLDETPVKPGEKIWVVGLRYDHELVEGETKVKSLEPVILPVQRSPRYREANLLAIEIEQAPSMVGGVLSDKKGRVRGFYASFSYNTSDGENAFSAGMSARLIRETVEQATGSAPPLRTLGVELQPISLADAVQRGLSPARVTQITSDDSAERQLLRIVRSETGHPAHVNLQAGDILLQIDDSLITTHDQLEERIDSETHALTVVRSGEELVLQVATGEAQPEVSRVIFWSGAYLHAPHRAARILTSMPPDGVYVSRTWYGSPASRAQLYSVSRIVAVDGIATPDLDAFIEATSDKPDRQGIKLSIEDHHGREEVITLEPDYTWWPTTEFVRADQIWTRRSVPKSATSE
jgi:S1-C subfamily serine protease